MDLTTLGIKVTTDGVQQAASQLDKLADAGDKAAASAEKMAPAIKKSGNALKEYPARQYQRELEKLISSYDKTEDKLSELARQQEKWNQLHKSGTIDTRALDAYTTRLDKVRNQMGLMAQANSKAAISSAQLQAANRNLPAQFTDIAVSLQAGQNPMTVFLQQGGQLKDMYGGAGPALKAMASYILGMVNPLTLAAAASAALFVAWRQGVNEQYEFNKTLIITGDRAGLAGRSLRDMVSALDSIDGVSRGTAINALNAVAASGKFTAEQFDLVTAAAAKMSASAGVEIDETVKKFEQLRKDPYDALLALTEAENFLTNEQLDRIRVLKNEGREQEAVAESIRIYADHLDDVSRKSREAMPALESAWRDIKGVITGTWGEAVKFLDVLSQIGSAAKNSRVGDVIRGAYNVAIPAHMRPDALQRLLRQANQITERYAPRETSQTPVVMAGIYGTVDPDEQRKRDREEQERNRERERFFAAETRYLDDKAKKTADIATVEKLVTDGVISREEATRRIGQIEDEYNHRASSASRTRRQQKTEEQKATEALIKAYESLNTQMDRRLFILSNGNDDAAALAYDFERGALSKMNDELARTLTYLDAMGNVRNFTSVADMRERMTNTIRAIEAEEDFKALYGGHDDLQKKAEETKDVMSAFADQAARNMQSSFADFLFNPFDDGIKGMAKGFSDTLRRMAAELAASKMFELLSTWATGYQGKGSGVINKIGSTMQGKKGYAEGGYTGAGGVYDPAGIVHKGEVVWSQKDVSRAGGVGVVEAMRLGLRGYASGGVVGNISSRITSASKPSVEVNIQNNTGNQMDTSEQSVNFDGEKWVIGIVAKAVGSGKLDRQFGSAFGVRRQGYSGA